MHPCSGSAFRSLARALVVALVCAAAGTALAQVPDAVWNGLRERNVTVEKKDGSEVSGKLINVEATTIVVMKANGQVVAVEKAQVAKVSGSAAAAPAPALPPMAPPMTAPPMAPPMTAPGMMPPMAPPMSGMAPAMSGHYTELLLLVKSMPVSDLVETLGKRKAQFAALSSQERYALMMHFQETIGSKAVGFLLNWIIFPGTGSLYQGDKGWGYPLLAAGFLGWGLFIGGVVQGFNGNSAGVGTALAGLATLFAAQLIGIIRPWVYEGSRYLVLKDFYAHPERFGLGVPQLQPPKVMPTLIAQPVGLPNVDGRITAPGPTLFGAGLMGSF